MGFRQAAVLSSVSFCLGILFICYSVDHALLYEVPLSERSLENGSRFYTTFFNAPPAIKGLLHAVVGMGTFALIAKLHKWDESAMFFDGTCIAVHVLAIGVYLTVTIPSLRIIVSPVADGAAQEEQIEAMRVLSAGNTIIMVLLGAILALQAGQEYARRVEMGDLKKMMEEEKAKEQAESTAKKEQ